MKKYIITFLLLMIGKVTMACPVCEEQQPKLLKGITHGSGPESNWDIAIVSITAILVLTTLFYTVKWLIKPGEESEAHIKRLFIEE